MGIVLRRSQSPFGNIVSFSPHNNSVRLIKDEETTVFPRPHVQASSPEPVSPDPCSSECIQVIFSLEPLLKPRKSSWLHLLVPIQKKIFLFYIKVKTLGQREKAAEEDEVPNGVGAGGRGRGAWGGRNWEGSISEKNGQCSEADVC